MSSCFWALFTDPNEGWFDQVRNGVGVRWNPPLGESQNNYSRRMFGPIPLARGGLEATLPFGFLSIAADRFSDVLDKVHFYPPA